MLEDFIQKYLKHQFEQLNHLWSLQLLGCHSIPIYVQISPTELGANYVLDMDKILSVTHK